MVEAILAKYEDAPITVWFGDEPKQMVQTQWLDQRQFTCLRDALIFVRGSRSQHSFFSIVAHLTNDDVDLSDEEIRQGIAEL